VSDTPVLRIADVTERLTDELHRLADHVDAQPSGTAMIEGVYGLLEVGELTGRLLQSAARWCDRHADDLFDDRRGAEQAATDVAAEAALALRKIGQRLRAAADDGANKLAPLQRLDRRELYMLGDDERADEPEYFAVVELDFSSAASRDLAWTSREDVARFKARQAARCGVPGRHYAVVHVLEGDRLAEPLATWPGEAA
jgi:hypothetical protein